MHSKPLVGINADFRSAAKKDVPAFPIISAVRMIPDQAGRRARGDPAADR